MLVSIRQVFKIHALFNRACDQMIHSHFIHNESVSISLMYIKSCRQLLIVNLLLSFFKLPGKFQKFLETSRTFWKLLGHSGNF
jgi:hypothetical protein